MLYVIELPKRSPVTGGGRRHLLQNLRTAAAARALLQAQSPTMMYVWSGNSTFQTTLSGRTAGPTSPTMLNVSDTCRAGVQPDVVANGAALFGRDTCLNTTVTLVYSNATNSTTTTVRVYANTDQVCRQLGAFAQGRGFPPLALFAGHGACEAVLSLVQYC